MLRRFISVSTQRTTMLRTHKSLIRSVFRPQRNVCAIAVCFHFPFRILCCSPCSHSVTSSGSTKPSNLTTMTSCMSPERQSAVMCVTTILQLRHHPLDRVQRQPTGMAYIHHIDGYFAVGYSSEMVLLGLMAAHVLRHRNVRVVCASTETVQR